MKLNYKTMLEDVASLVETDECFDLVDGHAAHDTDYTQQEARRMAELLGNIYSIAHGVHTGCCAGNYQIEE